MSAFGTATSAQIYGKTPTVFGDGNTGVNLINELWRIQDASYDFNIPRTDVSQYGNLGPIDRVSIDSPTVTLNFSYLLGSFINEKYLGFALDTLQGATTTSNCLQGFIGGTQNDKNYFIKTIPAVVGDLNDPDVTQIPYTGEVIGIGNGFISSYSFQASVGDFPRASVSVEGLNMKVDKIACFDKIKPQVDTGTQYIPAIEPVNGTAITTSLYSLPRGSTSPTGSLTMVSAFKKGDIRLNLSSLDVGGASITDAKIQSVNLNIPMSRTPIEKLGTPFPYTRELDLPITATCSFTALVGDLQTGTLLETINNNKKYNLSVLLQPQSVTPTAFQYPQYFMSGAQLDSISYSSDIGSNKSATYNFSIPFGPNSSVIMSGNYTQSF